MNCLNQIYRIIMGLICNFQNKIKKYNGIIILCHIFIMFSREDKIESKRFKSNKEWIAHLNRLRKLAAARRSPPSPLIPVR